MLKKFHGVILVLLFILILIWWGTSSEAAETQVEIGPAQIGAQFTGVMLTLSERLNDRYDFTVGYISRQHASFCDRPDCDWEIQEQLLVGVEYLVRSPWTDKLRLGIGPYYFQNADRVGSSNFRMGLDIEYRFNKRFGIRARHFSNAGTGPQITICRQPEWNYCITNNWNSGQDSWLRLVYYFAGE